MKFLRDGVEYAQVPSFFLHRKIDDYPRVAVDLFSRLTRVNMVDGNKVEPIYSPVIHIEADEKVTFVDFGWDKTKITVVLLRSWPFVSFVRNEKLRFEDTP